MGHRTAGLGVASLIALLSFLDVANADTDTPRLDVTERQVSQVGADWRIAYRLRYAGPTLLRLDAEEMCLEYEAVVSNARCPAHSFPRSVELKLQGGEGLAGSVELIPGERTGARCRERVTVELHAEQNDSASCRESPAILQVVAVVNDQGRPRAAAGADPSTAPPIVLEPGDAVSMVVKLEHLHGVCRDRDPLLGPRRFRVRFGPAVVEDAVNLDRVHAASSLTFPALTPEDSRCDSDTFHSPPSSLHLHDGRPRDSSYCFPSVPVHHGSTVSVSFWYCVRPGSEGTCRVRVGEYQDHERGWTRLGDGFDEALPARGGWTRFERQFTVRADATTLTLDFRFAGGQAGEAWIDDVEILPATPLDASR